MKKFLLRTLLFCFLLFLCVNALLFLAARNNDFIGGICLKHKTLTQTESPKIILVGGSGVGYSIDSELLRKKTGKQVVNMGLYAQFGLRYMCEEIKDDIRPGDAVFIIPEYSQFYLFFEGWTGLNELIFVHPQSLTHLKTRQQFKTVAKSFPRFYQRKIGRLGSDLYELVGKKNEERNYFDAHGDYIGHLEKTDSIDLSKHGLFPPFVQPKNLRFNPAVIPYLNDYADFIESKGAQMYFLFPTVPQEKLAKQAAFAQKIEKELKQKATFPILNTPENAALPLSDFYDTVYHLRKPGRRARTEKTAAAYINFLKR